MRRIKNPNLHHAAYDGTLRHRAIVDIVDQLIGPGVRYRSTKLNLKSAGYGSPVEWHQDWAFYPHTNDDILAVGVAIDAMTEDNGGMMVVPGSHRGPLYDHHQDGYFVGAVTDHDVDPAEAVLLEVPAGGISLHHVRTLHGSAPNRSSRPRRLLLLELCAIDAWPLVQQTDWETFNGRILRGAPTNTPRVTPVPVRIPPARPRAAGIDLRGAEQAGGSGPGQSGIAIRRGHAAAAQTMNAVAHGASAEHDSRGSVGRLRRTRLRGRRLWNASAR